MVARPTLPSADAAPEEHADWLEYCTLRSAEGGTSIRQFMRDLSAAGTGEVIDIWEHEEGSPLEEMLGAEGTAESAFEELHERYLACGGKDGAYPFHVEENSLLLGGRPETSVYTFLLLLSRLGREAGPPEIDAAELFEDISARAAERYLGGSRSNARAVVFGFPRKVLPKGFAPALDALCSQLGEGEGHRTSPKTKDEKDARLDIVAWRDFQDKRPGKLIAFGQCATGSQWRTKLTDLPPTTDWCDLWMRGLVTVSPIRLFCVPHRVDRENWLHTGRLGGILFERCRIAQLAADLDGDLADACTKWSRHVLREIRRR